MRLIIDRIEDKFAVCETESGNTVNVPLEALPEVHEGDVVNVTVDAAARKEIEAETEALMRRLWKK